MLHTLSHRFGDNCLLLLLPRYSACACPYGESPAPTEMHTRAPDNDANVFIPLHYLMQNIKQLICCWEVPAPPLSEARVRLSMGVLRKEGSSCLRLLSEIAQKRRRRSFESLPFSPLHLYFFTEEQVWEGEGVAHSTFPIVRQCENAAKLLIQQWPIYLQAEMEISLDTVKHPKTF